MGHIILIVAGSWLVLDALVVVFLYLEKSRRPAPSAQSHAARSEAEPEGWASPPSARSAVTREREALLTVARDRARFRQHREEEASSDPLVLSPHAGRSRVRQR